MIENPNLRWMVQCFKTHLSIESSLRHVNHWRSNGGFTAFLGESDCLVVDPEIMIQTMGVVPCANDKLVMPIATFLILLICALEYLKKSLPSIERITIYGKTRVCARGRSVEELQQYKKAGLVYPPFFCSWMLMDGCSHLPFAIVSDSILINRIASISAWRAGQIRFFAFSAKAQIKQTILQLEKRWIRFLFVQKKMNGPEIRSGWTLRNGIQKKKAGLSCGVYIMPGLGGRKWSDLHAKETADVINKMNPQFVRLRSLQVVPESSLAEAVSNGY